MWKVFPNMSGDGLPPMGWAMRIEVTKWERWPYSTNSLVPLIIGLAGGAPPPPHTRVRVGGPATPDISCSGVQNGDNWADAGVGPSAASPPATTALPLRSSLRLVRF